MKNLDKAALALIDARVSARGPRSRFGHFKHEKRSFRVGINHAQRWWAWAEFEPTKMFGTDTDIPAGPLETTKYVQEGLNFLGDLFSTEYSAPLQYSLRSIDVASDIAVESIDDAMDSWILWGYRDYRGKKQFYKHPEKGDLLQLMVGNSSRVRTRIYDKTTTYAAQTTSQLSVPSTLRVETIFDKSDFRHWRLREGDLFRHAIEDRPALILRNRGLAEFVDLLEHTTTGFTRCHRDAL